MKTFRLTRPPSCSAELRCTDTTRGKLLISDSAIHFYFFYLSFILFIKTEQTLICSLHDLANSLELLHTHEIVDTVDGHGLDHLVAGELPHGLGALLPRLLGLLHGDELVAVQGDTGSHFSPVSSRLLEFLSDLKRQIHTGTIRHLSRERLKLRSTRIKNQELNIKNFSLWRE